MALARPIVIISRHTARAAFTASYFFGFFFTLFSIYWVGLVTIPGTIATVFIVALYYSVVLSAFNRLYRLRPWLGYVALPILWVGLEYFRTLSEFAFPWSDLGYTQSYLLYVIQIVSVISVHGLSVLIVAVNVLLVIAMTKTVSPPNRLTSVFASLAVVLGLTAYGWIVVPAYPQPGEYPVALLQGSVSMEDKWASSDESGLAARFDSLAQSLRDTTIKLYIWPETAMPCYPQWDPECRQLTARVARNTTGHHLVGALGAQLDPDGDRYYNSCFQFDPNGNLNASYDKVKLVPFSEHVPYQDYVPFMQKKFLREYLTFLDDGGVQWWSDFYPGDSLHLFELPDARYAVLICFESTFPEYARKAIRMGADFLVGITNDTWFGRSVGIHMHSRIFITRAIENRSWAARVANTGLTYVVDAYGRIRDEVGLYEVTALKSSVRKLDGYSVFTRYGDVAGRWSFLITLTVLGILGALWFKDRFLSRSSASS